MSHRLGADIGGTFTDLVLVDDAGGLFQVGKVLTTPTAPADAVIEGTVKVLDEARRVAARRDSARGRELEQAPTVEIEPVEPPESR